MSQMQDLQTLIEQINTPTFLVKEGTIVAANHLAIQHFVEIGSPVAPLFVTGQEEYDQFQGSEMYVSMKLVETIYRCTIIQLPEYQLFQLDESPDMPDLQILALVSQQMRLPVYELSLIMDKLSNITVEDKAQMNQSLYKLQRILGNMSDAWQYANVPPHLITFEICSLLEEVFEKSQALLSPMGIHLRYTLPGHTIYTLAEPDMLKRAVYNMISNAVKFSPIGSTLEVSVTTQGKKIYISLANSSRKDPKSGGNLFRRYQRSPSLEPPIHGIGLGMSLIHSAAAAHNGAVFVEHPDQDHIRITMSIAIQKSKDASVRSQIIKPDIYGGLDPALIELSDILSHQAYEF